MNYLTNYYKNLSEQLQVKLSNLEAQVQQLNEAPMAYGQDDTGVGNAPFSGAYLGQLLGQGNMADVYNYLGQYGGGAVPGMSALTQGRRRVSSRDVESAGGGAPRGGQQFSGAYLGQLLGQGNMNAVNQYLSQFGGAQVAGPALRSANRPTSSGRDLESAGGGVNPMAGDYNGDGRVDGADLGLALGGGQNSSSVINNWSAPYSVGGPAFLRTTPGQQGGQGGVYAGGAETEGPTPTLGGAAGGPGGGAYGDNRPRGAAPAGGPGGRGAKFNAPEYAGGGAPRGGAKPRNYIPTLGGQAEGPGSNGSYSSTPSGASPTGGDMVRPMDLPPLTDLNGDGRIDGSDLGRYMDIYGYPPPSFQNTNAAPPAGQPGSFTPINIGGYSPSGYGVNRPVASGLARRRRS